MRALVVTLVALSYLCTAPVRASTVLDQSYSGPPTVSFLVSDIHHNAQTFAVGLGGLFVGIDVGLNDHPSGTGILTVSLLNSLGGVPNNVLGSQTINASSITGIGGFYNFDFSALNIFVSPGDILAFSLIGDLNSHFSARADTTPAYAGGSRYFKNTTSFPDWTANNADHIFRTYVDPAVSPPAVPLPAALPLLAAGLGAMGFLGWCKKRRVA